MTKITLNNNNRYFDWKLAAAGAAGFYTTGLLLIFSASPFICGGLAVASVWSFANCFKKKETDPKQLHKFVPKSGPIKTDRTH